MTLTRTYLFNRTSSEMLAELCSRQEDFFLENVDDLNSAVAGIQAMLSAKGLSSEVEHAPLNSPAGWGDLLSATVPAIGLLSGLASGLARVVGSATGPSIDVTLRLTSATSFSVIFARYRAPD